MNNFFEKKITCIHVLGFEEVKDNFKHTMSFVTLAKYLTESETLFSKDAPISLYSKLKKFIACQYHHDTPIHKFFWKLLYDFAGGYCYSQLASGVFSHPNPQNSVKHDTCY